MIFEPILGLLLTAEPVCDKLSFTSSVLFEMYLVADLSKHMDGAILVVSDTLEYENART